MGEYSYTTIAMEPGQSPRIGVNVRGGESVSVLACTDGDSAQVSVMQEGVSISFTPAEQTAITTADVHTAREMAAAFAAYATKVEILHTQQTTNPMSETADAERAA